MLLCFVHSCWQIERLEPCPGVATTHVRVEELHTYVDAGVGGGLVGEFDAGEFDAGEFDAGELELGE